MDRFLDRIERWIVAALLMLCLLLAWAASHYRNQSLASATQLHELSAAVEHQKREAARTLATLTAQRDAKQAALDTAHQQQEKADATATLEITRLQSELATRPVRVRIAPQPATSGQRCHGTAGDTATGADHRAAHAAQTIGLLPEPNSRRLAAVIAEAETINAAYASCRAQLLTRGGLQ